MVLLAKEFLIEKNYMIQICMKEPILFEIIIVKKFVCESHRH
jgi:hypothetical protein